MEVDLAAYSNPQLSNRKLEEMDPLTQTGDSIGYNGLRQHTIDVLADIERRHNESVGDYYKHENYHTEDLMSLYKQTTHYIYAICK